MSKFPITVQGARALEEEVEHLKDVLCPQTSRTITEACELGDLRGNTEYHAAREQQGMIETRVRGIGAKLFNVQVIDVTAILHNGKVIFGATVDIANVETDEAVTCQIAGDDEVDIRGGRISANSPIARALIGKTKSDAVLVRALGGDVKYEIVKACHT